MRYWIAIVGLALSGSALAGQADVCYSVATPNGLVDKLTGATPLDCPVAGRHSLAQLAQAGWSVASAQPVTVDYSVDPANQAPHSSNSWMVIIQKEGNK